MGLDFREEMRVRDVYLGVLFMGGIEVVMVVVAEIF